MDPARRKILTIIDRLASRAARMLREITSYAELPLKETRTSETLSAFLAERGFRVKRGMAGMETAFRAEFAFGKGRPVVAFLCGPEVTPTQLRKAASRIPSGIQVIAVYCSHGAQLSRAQIGDLVVLTVGSLEDLPAAMRRVAA